MLGSALRIAALSGFSYFSIAADQDHHAKAADHPAALWSIGSDGALTGQVHVVQNTLSATDAESASGPELLLRRTPMCQSHPEFCASLLSATGALPESQLRSLPEQIALAVYDIGYSPVLQEFFLNKLAIDTRVMFDWATRDPDAFVVAAESASTRFAEGLARSIAVHIASEMMGQWVSEAPVFNGLDVTARAMIAAGAASFIDEAMWAVEMAPKGLEAALISASFRRTNELIDIVQATRGLEKDQDRFFLAAALGIQGAVELKATTHRDSARAVADNVYQNIVALIPEASVGNDEAAVTEVFRLARQALEYLALGDVEAARIRRDALVDFAKAMEYVSPFSVLTLTGIGDWSRAALNWGKDTPERAANIVVGATALSLLDDPAALAGHRLFGVACPPGKVPCRMAEGRSTPKGNAPSADEDGEPAEKNNASMEQMRSAAENGDPKAQVALGKAYADGDGVPQDETEAVNWYRLAAERGDAEGQVSLGIMYSRGRGVPQDRAEAVRWYRMAAEQGYPRGEASLGEMIYAGLGIPKDEAAGLRWIRSAVEKGDSEGQLLLGRAYLSGVDGLLEQDKRQAVRLIELSVGQGLSYGIWDLAQIYALGDGVEQDGPRAMTLYEALGAAGNHYAFVEIGRMHENGTGVPQNYEAAAKWYRMAAEQGDAFGQFLLGGMYADGTGVAWNQAEAAKWYRMAAEQGDQRAQNRLGRLYVRARGGSGLEQDPVEAEKWYRMAAEQGDVDAQYNLGLLYQQGGVTQDTAEAMKWFESACAAGSEDACVEKRKLERALGQIKQKEDRERKERAEKQVAEAELNAFLEEWRAELVLQLGGDEPIQNIGDALAFDRVGTLQRLASGSMIWFRFFEPAFADGTFVSTDHMMFVDPDRPIDYATHFPDQWEQRHSASSKTFGNVLRQWTITVPILCRFEPEDVKALKLGSLHALHATLISANDYQIVLECRN